MGIKMSLGKYNDSTIVYRNPVNNAKYYTTSPPTIQPTSGSQDFIFYGFAYRGYSEYNFRVFASGVYIKKGWNPLGQKFGDYASLALFAGKSISKKFSATLQLRGEWVLPMQSDKNIDMLALYNIDVNSTGGRKLFIAPQLSYANGNVICYVLYEAPVYQYLNGTQVGSQHLLSTGISYRIFVAHSE
jgi:hypothetical protein